MKKTIILFLFVLMLSPTVLGEVSTKRLEWYYKPTTDHSRPDGASEAHFLEEHDAYYIGKDEKCVYLTFDLGFENESVSKIVETLRKESVPATFFVLSHPVENGELIDDIVSDGHVVANHTAHHKDMTKAADLDAFRYELESLEESFKKRTGKEIARFYRAPKGVYSEENLAWAKELGYKTVFWSLAWADWEERSGVGGDYALDKILKRLHNGAIILLHPTSKANAEMLPKLIATLKKDGWEFKTVLDL